MTATVKLRSRDGQIIEVEQKLALQSETICSTLSKTNMSTGTTIDCPAISGAVLSLAFEWLQHHINDPPPAPEITEGHCRGQLSVWDEQFFSRLALPTLYQLLLAADQLQMVRLLNACNKTVARMMIGKSPAEIRATFDIPDDL